MLSRCGDVPSPRPLYVILCFRYRIGHTRARKVYDKHVSLDSLGADSGGLFILKCDGDDERTTKPLWARFAFIFAHSRIWNIPWPARILIALNYFQRFVGFVTVLATVRNFLFCATQSSSDINFSNIICTLFGCCSFLTCFLKIAQDVERSLHSTNPCVPVEVVVMLKVRCTTYVLLSLYSLQTFQLDKFHIIDEQYYN